MTDKIVVSGYDAVTGVAKSVTLLSELGATHIFIAGDLPAGLQETQEIDALNGTEQTITWSFANGVKAVAIYAVSEDETLDGTGAAAALNEVVVVCVDPPNNTVRDSWLTAASGLSERLPLIANRDPLVLTFKDAEGNYVGVDSIGIKRDIGSNAVRIFAIGVEADS